jgi:hypothetical protein
MPPALSKAASIIARTSAVSRFGVPFGLPWPDVLLLGIRKSPHFALSVSVFYFGTETRRCKPADSVPLGEQLQIDFADRRVEISGVTVKVFLFVATLGYSRRLHVQSTTMVAIDYG